ncbi:sulfatase [Membranihabitans marinus]|uniref:sulfatase n=1 Tax=Membranihabitans marinus TaxID=1227546 RepID=UPI001F22C391|nr:sulfatase [Membranihabitans marinus]
MNRKIEFTLFFIAIGLSVLSQDVQRNNIREDKPNIVFILADDLGYSDVNCFNGLGSADYYETPNIDRLAAQGMKFTSAYTNGPNCAPTRAALMSGQYYPRQPVFTVGNSDRGEEVHRKLIPVTNGHGIPSSSYIMAEALRDAGYATGHFGKWHLGKASPEEQGFSSESVVDVTVNGEKLYQNKKLGGEGQYIADELNRRALAFIEDHQDEPFFLYLSHYLVHSPFQAPDSLVQKYLNKRPVMGHYHATYAAMVESLDNSVGRLMDKLDRLGLSDNTLVIFYSDNGGLGGYIDQGMEGLPKLDPIDDGFGGTVEITHNAPLRGGKGQLYEGGVRVPLIMRWPDVIAPGSVCDEAVISIDFYPTLVELAGGQVEAGHILDGYNILPLMIQPQAELDREALYWHFPGYLQSRQEGSWRTTPVGSIVADEWKLIQFFEDNTIELYNLKDDLGEQNNLADVFPDKKEELLHKLNQWRMEMKAEMPRRK